MDLGKIDARLLSHPGATKAFHEWRVLRPGGSFVLGDVRQPAPARALMNAWMPRSREGACASTPNERCGAFSGNGLTAWFGAVSERRLA